MKTKILTLTIALLLPAASSFAQEDGPRRPGAPRDGERPQGGPRDGQRPAGPMPMPLLPALDADGDGIISAEEMKNATAALQKLDKNGDGKLTREEWQSRPQGDGPRRGPEGDQDGKPRGPRDGERPQGGPRDGERPQGGPRDGERPQGDAPREGERQRSGPREGRQREQNQGERPPAPPLVGALDTDRDGVISAEEMDKASDALAKLDQNKDNQLGPREYGQRPPQGAPREGGRQGGREGERPPQ